MNIHEDTAKEINASLRRYIRYCLGNMNFHTAIAGEGRVSIFFRNEKGKDKFDPILGFDNFWEQLKSFPFGVFIVGCEEHPKKDKVFKELRYFYEIFPEICGYVSAPFNPGLVRLDEEKLEYFERLLRQINELYKSVQRKLKDREKPEDGSSANAKEKEPGKDKAKMLHDLHQFFKDAWMYFGIDPEQREEITHATRDESQGERNLKIQVANLIAGLSRIGFCGQDDPPKLLLIDNRPDREFKQIDERFHNIFREPSFSIEDILQLFEGSKIAETHIFDGKRLDFRGLVNDLRKLKAKKDPKLELCCRKPKENQGAQASYQIRPLAHFDFILVDMYLGENQPDGIEILNLLTEVFPQIPAFVLSVSDDFAVMHKAIEGGADYYIIKNQAFSVPYAYCNYLDEIGKILRYVPTEKYRKALVGNIRYWRFVKNLWFGDKCYHMINHSFKHTLDDWNHMNEILLPLIKEERDKKDISGKRERGKNKEESFKEEGRLFYCFCMSIWLHDIGHKGSDLHGEPHLIRDNHGYISGELILRYPELFRILGEERKGGKNGDFADQINGYYKSIDFRRASALEMIYKREDENLSFPEMIALFAMYHKSNTPLDWEEYQQLLERKRVIPLEYYVGKEEKHENILTLQKILEKRMTKIKDKDGFVRRFLRLAALFRFIDSIDIRAIRVGDLTEKELKVAVIKNDKEYQYRKLEKEIETLSKLHTKRTVESALFVKSFYADVKDQIERGEFTQLNLPKELVKKPEDLENYRNLVDYTAFIALQPTHFDLHTSVKDLKFEYRGSGRLVIVLITDKSKEWLKERNVRERGKKEQSVYDRLIGDDCYIEAELEAAKKHLRSFFSKVAIRLEHDGGELYGKKVWQP